MPSCPSSPSSCSLPGPHAQSRHPHPRISRAPFAAPASSREDPVELVPLEHWSTLDAAPHLCKSKKRGRGVVARATDLCSFAVGEAEGGLVQLGVVDTSSATATAHLHPESENMYSLVAVCGAPQARDHRLGNVVLIRHGNVARLLDRYLYGDTLVGHGAARAPTLETACHTRSPCGAPPPDASGCSLARTSRLIR